MKHLLLVIALACFSFTAIGSKNCSTFTIGNGTSYSVGDVTLSGDDGSTVISVTSTGEFNQTICITPTVATINHFIVAYPNQATVMTENGDLIDVKWQSPSLINLWNHTLQNIHRGVDRRGRQQ